MNASGRRVRILTDRPVNAFFCDECGQWVDTDDHRVECACGAELHPHGTTPSYAVGVYKRALEDMYKQKDEELSQYLRTMADEREYAELFRRP